MTTRSRSEILEEVEDLASEVQQLDTGASYDEAMSIVWENTDLYDEYSAAPPEQPMVKIAKAQGEATLADTILEAAHRKASNMAWSRWPESSIEDLVVEAFQTPEGQLLYDTYRSEQGRLPVSVARQQISKGYGERSVWDVIRDWWEA